MSEHKARPWAPAGLRKDMRDGFARNRALMSSHRVEGRAKRRVEGRVEGRAKASADQRAEPLAIASPLPTDTDAPTQRLRT